MDISILEYQDSEAVKNSFYRSPKVTPTINKYTEYIEVRTIDDKALIYKIEETMLAILAQFKYLPFWLIDEWYEDMGYSDDYAFHVVDSFIKVGLVTVETSTLGVFLRPTKFLLDLMGEEKQTYIPIPFNMLNHNLSEAKLLFDIRMGNPKSELWQLIKEEEFLPCFHPLGIQPTEDNGTIILSEASFRANRFQPGELLRREKELKQDIYSNKRFTKEFNDFSYFPIVFEDANGTIVTQTPDNIVPIPRQNKLPQSYAIEIELSDKTIDRYVDIMRHYKDNIKFGKLFYLCASTYITNLVKRAFKEVGGLGNCELYILPYIPPAMKLSNYRSESEKRQKALLDRSGE